MKTSFRYHQLAVSQWGFSKGFDTFAPLGPCLVSAALIPDPSDLHLHTIIDGEVRQEESVGDLLLKSAVLYVSCRKIVEVFVCTSARKALVSRRVGEGSIYLEQVVLLMGLRAES